jgi:hypothetical protein
MGFNVFVGAQFIARILVHIRDLKIAPTTGVN